ncbi:MULTISPECIES: hypothetical protein [unclassified Microcoleus]|uniref:hypothetical protein n=1 Tax=unclassified Microcoleus TaxID=2642155 RepID=UPI002FD73B06
MGLKPRPSRTALINYSCILTRVEAIGQAGAIPYRISAPRVLFEKLGWDGRSLNLSGNYGNLKVR